MLSKKLPYRRMTYDHDICVMFYAIFLEVWVAVVRTECLSATYRAIATEVVKCLINGRINLRLHGSAFT